ncbi:MAG: hypothetical protein Q8K68_09250, partial [Nitrospirota bacterium]|nr:hypothetical protein [Nitrospirota bacterium]
FRENPGGYHTITISAFDTPNVMQGKEVIPGLITRENVEATKNKYGEKSAFYRASVKAEFTMTEDCYFDTERLSLLQESSKQGETFKPHVIGRRYGAAIDPAGQGVGEKASAHSMSILDCQTGEFVVDYTSMESPEDFAQRAYQIWRDFQRPLLQIEPNGVGLAMIVIFKGLAKVDGIELNLVYADKDRTKVGWPASDSQRDRMLVDLAMGIRQGALIPYSRAAIDELFSFEKKEKGSPAHALGARDDRVMAMAWANWVSGQVPRQVTQTEALSYARL